MFELKHHSEETEDGQPASSGPAPAELHCTRGRPSPPGLADDVRAIVDLPVGARDRFWELLVPYLRSTTPSEDEQRALSELCDALDVDPARLVPAIKSARFLISQAAKAALDVPAFARDLAQLADGQELDTLCSVLVPCFERAAPVIRDEIVSRTIIEHGKLVRGTHWRVDKIINSEHGDGVNVPVAVLSFEYQEGGRNERITLHLLPDQLTKLKDACQQMLP